jgi:hypothetical protein
LFSRLPVIKSPIVQGIYYGCDVAASLSNSLGIWAGELHIIQSNGVARGESILYVNHMEISSMLIFCFMFDDKGVLSFIIVYNLVYL